MHQASLLQRPAQSICITQRLFANTFSYVAVVVMCGDIQPCGDMPEAWHLELGNRGNLNNPQFLQQVPSPRTCKP